MRLQEFAGADERLPYSPTSQRVPLFIVLFIYALRNPADTSAARTQISIVNVLLRKII
jgi:hypothetical protein